MKTGSLLASLLLVGFLAIPPIDAEETTSVRVKDITLQVPRAWKQEEPKSQLRLAQFRILAAAGDKEDAELTVFSFGASSVEANIRRWIDQFEAKGRNVKITQGESANGKYMFVNLSGTYNKPIGPPIAGKTEPMPGARVLAVILASPEKGVYYFKLAGPDKTVADQTDALRGAFGAEASKEKELKIDG